MSQPIPTHDIPNLERTRFVLHEFSGALRKQPLEFQVAVACSVILTLANRLFASPSEARSYLRTTAAFLPCGAGPHIIDHDLIHQVGSARCRQLQAPERQMEIAIYVGSLLARLGTSSATEQDTATIDLLLGAIPCTVRAGLVEVVCSAPDSSYENPLAISLTAPAAIVSKMPSTGQGFLH